MLNFKIKKIFLWWFCERVDQHNQRPHLSYGVQSTPVLFSNSKVFFELI